MMKKPLALLFVVMVGCGGTTAQRDLTASLAQVVQAARGFRTWSKDYERGLIKDQTKEAAEARVALTRPVADKALDLLEQVTNALEQALKPARGGR